MVYWSRKDSIVPEQENNQGKKLFDKRDALKEKDEKRDAARSLKASFQE